jgi:putative flippase GtrA
MLQKIWSIKLTRFLCVGVFNTLFDLSILNSLVFLGHVPVLLANLISASTSMSVSYFLNHHIVFRSGEKHSVNRFVRFFVVTGFGILAIQTCVIYLITHLLAHQSHAVTSVETSLHITKLSVKAFELNLAKLIAVLVAMAWNFIIYHFVVFKSHSQSPDQDVLL